MIKILFFQVLFFFNIVGKTCNGVEKSEIFWTKNVALKWDDFQGLVPETTKFSAVSTVTVRFKYTSKEKIKKVKTYSNFSKESSWVKDKTDPGLAHEKLHFDITEYCRRKSQERIDSIINKDSFITEALLITIFRETIEYHKNMQEQYDLETDHSGKTFKQIEWDEKVENWLKERK